MRRSLWVVVIFLAVSLAGSVRADEVWTTFYNCALSSVGGSLLECDNDFTPWMQQYGAFKSVERYYCDPIEFQSITWYAWNGSSWVQLDEAPEPTC